MAMFMSACRQAPVNFPAIPPPPRCQEKVVVVMGSTGTGKSRLSIDLALRFGGEVINSDKIQVHRGLDIISNRITADEARGVPHHLLGVMDPDGEFTAEDYVHHATLAAESIRERGHLPIIAGGSNSFIEAFVKQSSEFPTKYEFFFLWIDVMMPVLRSVLSKRVDRMVERGLVAEAREFYDPGGDYSHGVRRAIGLPEMDEFFRREGVVNGETRDRLLKVAIDEIKANTFKLASRQVEKILRFREELGWPIHRLDATEVFLTHHPYAAKAWEAMVLRPSSGLLARFLCDEEMNLKSITI